MSGLHPVGACPALDADAAIVDSLCRHAVDRDGDVWDIIDREVRRLAPLRERHDQVALTRRALARLTGLGELDLLLSDPDVNEVLVNAGRDVWIDRCGTLSRAGHLDEHSVEHLLERVLAPLGRRVDRTSPIVDARLADGSRVCAVLAPVAIDGSVLSIRRFPTRRHPLGAFTSDPGVSLLRELIEHRCNIVVSGATSSGKTSLLASMLALVDDSERLIVVEDTAELVVDSANTVRLEARPALADGPPSIELRDLVRTSMRLRPDRLVVGEVRGDEVLALVQAMNTGHDGSLSTCHSNSPLDALLRLESLVLQAAPSWPLAAIRQQIQRSLDVVVHTERDHRTGARAITAIAEVVGPGETSVSNAPEVRMLTRVDGNGRLVQCDDLNRRRR